MVRTPETWSLEPSGPPRVVARHVEMPGRLFEHPDRPVTVYWELSKAERFLKAFTKAVAEARARSQVSPEQDGDGS